MRGKGVKNEHVYLGTLSYPRDSHASTPIPLCQLRTHCRMPTLEAHT